MHSPDLADINWWSWQNERLPMGWFLLDFVFLLIMLAVALRGPLKKMFSARHHAIKRAVAQAAAQHAKASQAHHEARHRLTTLEQELREMSLRSEQDGQAERTHLVAQAEAYAARLAREADAQAGEMLQRMQQRLRRQLMADTLASVEAELASRIAEGDHRRLLGEAIDVLGSVAPKATKRAHT